MQQDFAPAAADINQVVGTGSKTGTWRKREFRLQLADWCAVHTLVIGREAGDPDGPAAILGDLKLDGCLATLRERATLLFAGDEIEADELDGQIRRLSRQTGLRGR